jgi:hypothetical protein
MPSPERWKRDNGQAAKGENGHKPFSPFPSWPLSAGSQWRESESGADIDHLAGDTANRLRTQEKDGIADIRGAYHAPERGWFDVLLPHVLSGNPQGAATPNDDAVHGRTLDWPGQIAFTRTLREPASCARVSVNPINPHLDAQ